MKKVYLDTSAFVKLFFDEEGDEALEKIANLAREKKLQIVISEWVINEAIWTVEKKVLKNKIGSEEAFKVVNLIADTVAEGVKEGTIALLKVNEDVIINSRVIIEELHSNAADSLHVFLARTSSCDFFLSADEDLVLLVRFGNLRIESVYLYSKIDMDKLFFNI